MLSFENTKTDFNTTHVVDAGMSGSVEEGGELGADAVVQKELDAALAFGVATAKATSAIDKAKLVEQFLYSTHKEQVWKEWSACLALYVRPIHKLTLNNDGKPLVVIIETYVISPLAEDPNVTSKAREEFVSRKSFQW